MICRWRSYRTKELLVGSFGPGAFNDAGRLQLHGRGAPSESTVLLLLFIGQKRGKRACMCFNDTLSLAVWEGVAALHSRTS